MRSPRTTMKARRGDRRLPSDNFQGHAPRARSHQTENAAMEAMGAAEGRWFNSSRYRRRAQVTSVTPLTATGTVRIGFRVVDGEPFHFDPRTVRGNRGPVRQSGLSP